mmetsp:Transcript_18329/g.29353  ORF Transcript_18329/g.29353 Transcript_18329/m.29353 type:complete len:300 (-) Transcript_18329:988-1887(-)
MGQTQPLANHPAGKVTRAERCDPRIEGQLEQALHTKLFQAACAGRLAHQPKRRGIGRKKDPRMRLECQHTQGRIRCRATGHFNHRLVPQMDAIKIANGCRGTPVLIFDKLIVAQDPHSACLAVRRHKGKNRTMASFDQKYHKGGRRPGAEPPFNGRSVELARRRKHHGFADQDFLALNAAVTVQFHPAFGKVDIDHLHLGIDHVARTHGGEKLEGLAHVNGPMARQLFADHCRNQPGGQHPVGNAPLKDGVAGIVIIQMHRVPVGRDLRKHLDVFVRDGFAQMARHAHFDIFDANRAAR